MNIVTYMAAAFLYLFTFCTFNLATFEDTTVLSKSACGINSIVLDYIFFLRDTFKLDTLGCDSINLLLKTERLALKNDQNGQLALDVDIICDSNGTGHVQTSAKSRNSWQFYYSYFSTYLRCPSRLGIELNELSIGNPFYLKGFRGFHRIVVICRSPYNDSLFVETVQGCKIETEVQFVAVKVLADSTEFKGITVTCLPDSTLKAFRNPLIKTVPEIVRIVIPEEFASWLKLEIRRRDSAEKRILIGNDTITETTFEGALHGGTRGEREISIVASESIEIITTSGYPTQ